MPCPQSLVVAMSLSCHIHSMTFIITYVGWGWIGSLSADLSQKLVRVSDQSQGFYRICGS